MEVASAPLIILIDDDPNDQELAQIALSSSNIPHRLLILRDGAEAVAWLQSPGTAEMPNEMLPHLILLDLKLPKVNGLEVLQSIRAGQRTKYLPTVIFTSSVEDSDLVKCYEFGANAYIRKPNNFNEYKKAITDMGRFWILQNQSFTGTYRELKLS